MESPCSARLLANSANQFAIKVTPARAAHNTTAPHI